MSSGQAVAVDVAVVVADVVATVVCVVVATVVSVAAVGAVAAAFANVASSFTPFGARCYDFCNLHLLASSTKLLHRAEKARNRSPSIGNQMLLLIFCLNRL